MALRQQLRAWLGARAKEVSERALEPLATEKAALWPRVGELATDLDRAEAKLGRLEADLEALTAPFTPTMTIHQAWKRHPGVAAIFARHHLPDCPACPVGADERLEEAAFGYGIPLDPWLAELNALLTLPQDRGRD